MTKPLVLCIAIMISAAPFLAQDKTVDSTKIELFKRSGKKVYRNAQDRYTIYLTDSIGEDSSTIITRKYEGALIEKTADSLFFKMRSFDQEVQSEWSFRETQHRYVIDDSLMQVKSIHLDNIYLVSREPAISQVAEAFGGAALFTSLILAPIVAFDYKKGSLNSIRYLSIISVTVPISVVGLATHRAFRKRYYKVNP